jgi:hypothetical protein
MFRNVSIALASIAVAGAVALPVTDASAKGRGASHHSRVHALRAVPTVKKHHWSASNRFTAIPPYCIYTPSGKLWCEP